MNEDDSVDLMINMYNSKESINKAEEKIDLDELASNIDHTRKEKKKRRKRKQRNKNQKKRNNNSGNKKK